MSEDLQDWDPMDSDFSSLNFNSYDRGPGQDLAIDHLPSYAGRSNSLNERKTVTLYVGKIPHGLEEEALKNMFARHGKVVRLCIKRNAANWFGGAMATCTFKLEDNEYVDQLAKTGFALQEYISYPETDQLTG